MKSKRFPACEIMTARPGIQRAAATVGGKTRTVRRSRTGHDLVPCPSCKGDVWVKVPQAQPQPVTQSINPGVAHLNSVAQARQSAVQPLTWAVGVTTVPERRSNGLLLRTLASLRAAGFNGDDLWPRLFVDGSAEGFSELGLPVSFRVPRVRTVANWVLAAVELLARNPQADRFVIFQDDVVMYRNLREYLDRTAWPDKGYLNLFTFKANERIVQDKQVGWHLGCPLHGKVDWRQSGLGALGLAFTREGLTALLQSSHVVRKLTDVTLDTRGMPAGQPKPWPDGGMRLGGQTRVDGMIVTAMNMAGWNEHVHYPSLVDHVGSGRSSMGNRGSHHAETFRGEDFDCLSLIQKG